MPSHPRRRALVCTASLLGLALARGAWAQGSAMVSLDEARRLHEAGEVVLIDIREPSEHATGVNRGARLLPMSQMSRRASEIPRDQPVLLICNTQNRSARAYQALRDAGWTQLRYAQGGMSEWARRGWPMVKP